MANPPLAGTEYVAHELTFTRGDAGDVSHVGIYAGLPNIVPDVGNVVGTMAGDFTVVDLIQPPDPLAEGTKIDVLAKITAGASVRLAADMALAAGDYQLWVLVATGSSEEIVRKTDVLTVI